MFDKNEKDFSIGEDAFNYIFRCESYFCRHYYFTKELWRKVKGFENEDKAEVHIAFLTLWLCETFNEHNYKPIYSYPLGCGWSTINGSKESYDEYIDRFRPLFKDYTNWCLSQR